MLSPTPYTVTVPREAMKSGSFLLHQSDSGPIKPSAPVLSWEAEHDLFSTCRFSRPFKACRMQPTIYIYLFYKLGFSTQTALFSTTAIILLLICKYRAIQLVTTSIMMTYKKTWILQNSILENFCSVEIIGQLIDLVIDRNKSRQFGVLINYSYHLPRKCQKSLVPVSQKICCYSLFNIIVNWIFLALLTWDVWDLDGYFQYFLYLKHNQ